jgi:hypothetical protein
MHSFTLSGSDCAPALAGGYLSLLKDGREIFIAAVPSPLPFADRHRETIAENDEIFEDEEGNEISISVQSSNVGIDWFIEVNQKEGAENLEGRLDTRFQANER